MDLSTKKISSISDYTFDASSSFNASCLCELILCSNLITIIRASTFNGLGSLQKLDLSGNQITTLNAKAFASLTNLNLLCLAQNQIKSLSAHVFYGLTSLVELDLKNNPLSSLSNAAIFNDLDFTNLAYIYLQNCMIDEIDDDFFEAINFPTPNVSNNTVGFYLYGNPIANVANGSYALSLCDYYKCYVDITNA